MLKLGDLAVPWLRLPNTNAKVLWGDDFFLSSIMI